MSRKPSPFYNKGGTPLTRTNAIGQIDLASAAFEDWRTIQAEDPESRRYHEILDRKTDSALAFVWMSVPFHRVLDQ